MDVDPKLLPLVAAVTDGERRKRDTQRAKRQFNIEEIETSADERSPVSHTEDDTSKVMEKEEGAHSAAGSAYNPENPYHVSTNFINNTVYDEQGSRIREFFINYQEAYTEP